MPAPGSPPPPDTTPPSVPTGVVARAVSPTAADLLWAASSDAVGVAGYTVRRDGVAVATVPADASSYRDAALAAEHPYAWTVEAFDAAGNRSSPSAVATATTPFVRRSSRSMLAALRRATETGPRVHRVVLPGLAGRGRRRLQHAGRGARRRGPAATPRRGELFLVGGRWRSPYDGRYRTRSSRMVVDHVVPLREAWRSGARGWRPHAAPAARQRPRLPRDPGGGDGVGGAGRRRGREPQDWLPRRGVPVHLRRRLGRREVAVAARGRHGRARFLTRTLRGCGWPQVRAPGRRP